jgi:hypothetical protein
MARRGIEPFCRRSPPPDGCADEELARAQAVVVEDEHADSEPFVDLQKLTA